MAEAFSVIIGVVGLLPICVNGFSFIESICKADQDLQGQLVRLQIQQADLNGWAHVWEIPHSIPSRKKNTKLQRWMDRTPSLAPGVLDALSAISDLFVDTARLEEKYRFFITREDRLSFHGL